MVVQKYRKTSKMQRSVWDEKEFVNERGTEAVKQSVAQDPNAIGFVSYAHMSDDVKSLNVNM